MTNPSVFLSYSHDSVAHKVWVRKLAEWTPGSISGI